MRPSLLVTILLLTASGFLTPARAQAPPPRLRMLVPHSLPASYPETAYPPAPFDRQREDRWLAPDKVKHAGGSFLLVLSSQYALTNKMGLSQGRALPLSIGVSATVGLAKELYDWKLGTKRYFSPRDLAADGAGILLAVGFILL